MKIKVTIEREMEIIQARFFCYQNDLKNTANNYLGLM